MVLEISTTAIIQARMSSSRFPGKVMSPISGKSMLEIQLERISLCKSIDEIIIATTVNKCDDYCWVREKIINKGFRGSEADVLSRYVEASKLTNAKTLVRLTADCPLIDAGIIKKVVDAFKLNNADYGSNINPPSYPDGLDVEVFSKEILFLANDLCKEPSKREHVTPWMINNKDIKKINISNSHDLSYLRWTVDYPEDLELIKNIINKMDSNIEFSWLEILDLQTKDNKIFEINRKHKRNIGSNICEGQKLWSRAKKIIPGGNMLLSKRSELFLPEGWPVYFSKTRGCRVWDISKKEYFDMSLMGVGTNILGYSNKEVDNKVAKTISLGNMSSLNCPEEGFLASLLICILGQKWLGSQGQVVRPMLLLLELRGCYW